MTVSGMVQYLSKSLVVQSLASFFLVATQVPHILDSLSGLYQSMDARVAMLGQLCQLQGKLDLLLAQVILRKKLLNLRKNTYD